MIGHKRGNDIFTQNVIKIPLFYFSLNLIQIDKKKNPLASLSKRLLSHESLWLQESRTNYAGSAGNKNVY